MTLILYVLEFFFQFLPDLFILNIIIELNLASENKYPLLVEIFFNYFYTNELKSKVKNRKKNLFLLLAL